MSKRFHIVSLGCPKNAVDAEGIGQLLRQQGYEEADEPRQADVLIVNTCGFIAPAREESLAALRELAQGKRRRQWLVAAGCLPERRDLDLSALVPGLDGIISTRQWSQFPAFLSRLVASQRAPASPCYTWPAPAGEGSSLVARVDRRATTGRSAYLKIADGCDAACAFCAIPQIKGPQQSKPAAWVVDEARQLAEQGVMELILVAQDTTAYGRDLGLSDALPDLISQVLDAAPAVRWLRVMYTYPQHISPRLVELMAREPRFCHYLDLPLQHSHPDVLRRMGRSPDIDRVRRLVGGLREAVPDVAIRTTFIVGYPGETEAEFEHLLDFMDEMAFDKVGVFPYSREEGTRAAELPGQVPDEIKQARHEEAMLLQQEISLDRNGEQVGRTLDVLFEGQGDGLSIGRSYRDAPEIDGLVLVHGDAPLGEMAPVRITEAMEYDLTGELA
ncbi:MAG: 30S ribosomal protein S12 methylthiotransferase RimO [Chloroflexi bacterium]|nr:30S ribosomal protein S12 methylthiotransferase RimO [Chloroflexota bacterium]